MAAGSASEMCRAGWGGPGGADVPVREAARRLSWVRHRVLPTRDWRWLFLHAVCWRP